MSEDDYIYATNLAKLRIAEHVLRDVLIIKPDEREAYQEAMKKIVWLRANYEMKMPQ